MRHAIIHGVEAERVTEFGRSEFQIAETWNAISSRGRFLAEDNRDMGIFPWGSATAICLGLLPIAVCGCKRVSAPTLRAPATSTLSAGIPAASQIAASPTDVGAIARIWQHGDREQAVDRWIQLAGSDASPELLRLSKMSESEFVLFPQSERDAISGELLSEISALRALMQMIFHRADAAMTAGNNQLAEKLILTTKRFGQINASAGNLQLSQIVGQSYVKFADARLRAMSAPASNRVHASSHPN